MIKSVWLLLAVWSGYAQALHHELLLPFLNSTQRLPTVEDIKQNDTWWECAELDTQPRWCSDSFQYYATSVWASITFDAQGQAGLTLYTAYSAHDWSQLQYALRRDGFQIAEVTIADQQFSITQQLTHYTATKVDRELVLFLNQYASQFPKQQTWWLKQRQAQLFTDGKEIQLHL